MIRRSLLVLTLCAGTLTHVCFAQARPETPEFDVKEHYTKYEYRIPMRDGVHLFTSVYVPKDASHAYPFLIDRTPYSVGPYGVDFYRTQLGPSPEFDKAGYIFVFQDVRGRYMSEGTFVEMRPHIDNKKSKQDVDDSSDLYDTIDWLLKNVPNNNGNAGIWGISYPGFFTSASIIDSHPALKAASPQAPMTDLFMGDDAYHGGAFMLAANFGFYSQFKPQENPQLPPKTPAPFRLGHERRLRVLSERGTAIEFTKISRRQERAMGRPGQSRHLRRLLESSQSGAAHEEHSLRGADRRRMVRRRGSAGSVLDISRDRQKQSGNLQRAGGGAVGARRMGAL